MSASRRKLAIQGARKQIAPYWPANAPRRAEPRSAEPVGAGYKRRRFFQLHFRPCVLSPWVSRAARFRNHETVNDGNSCPLRRPGVRM